MPDYGEPDQAINGNQSLSTFNKTLHSDHKYCNVDLLRSVDDNPILKRLSKQVAAETHLPVNTLFVMGLTVYSSVAARKYSVPYQNGRLMPIGLEQEILKLKGETTKPKIKPSKMDKDSTEDGDENGDDCDKSTMQNLWSRLIDFCLVALLAPKSRKAAHILDKARIESFDWTNAVWSGNTGIFICGGWHQANLAFYSIPPR